MLTHRYRLRLAGLSTCAHGRTNRLTDPLAPAYQLPAYEPHPPVEPHARHTGAREHYPVRDPLYHQDIPGTKATVRTHRSNRQRDQLNVKDINAQAPKKPSQLPTRPLRSLDAVDINGPTKYHRQGPNYISRADPDKWDRQMIPAMLKGKEFGRVPKKVNHALFGELPRKTVIQRPLNLVEPLPTMLIHSAV